MSNDSLNELSTSFMRLKKEQGLRAELDEIDSIFYIRDAVLSAGYVSRNLSQQICARITEVFMNWNSYLHGLVMPDPHHLIQMNESKFLTADDKKKVLALIARSMELVSRNTLIHARPDSRAETRLIDEAVVFWNEVYQPQLVSIIELLRARWGA